MYCQRGLDELNRLVANNLVRYGMTLLHRNLGRSELSKIEKRLQEKYGTDLHSVILSSTKSKDIIIEFFGELEATAFEYKISCMLKMFESMTKVSAGEFFEVSDNSLAQRILKTISDKQKAELISAFDTPQTVQNVLKRMGLSQTTSYRKINEIIDDGFVIFRGHDWKLEGKQSILYSRWFDVKIVMEGSRMVVYARVNNERLKPVGMNRYSSISS